MRPPVSDREATGRPAKRDRIRRWLPWVALVAVACVVLGLGIHQASAGSSLDARTAHIAGLVRCPVCNGETVAQSQATPAVEIRDQIKNDLQNGESQSRILSGLVAEYGPSILEKPPATGAGLIVWILPIGTGIAALVGVGFVLRKWRNRGRLEDLDDLPLDAHAEFAFEVATGVESATDAATLPPEGKPAAVRVDVAPVATVPQEKGKGVALASLLLRSKTKRWVLAGTGVVLVVGGASWALASFTGTRLPGEEVTGKTLTGPQVSAELLAANADESKGNVVAAVGEYQKVLNVDQTNVEALCGEGWLLAQTGQPALLDKGLAMLVNAEKVDPAYGPAHLYRGIALLGEGDYTDAIPELEWYLGHQPEASLKAEVSQALAKAEAEQAAAAKG